MELDVLVAAASLAAGSTVTTGKSSSTHFILLILLEASVFWTLNKNILNKTYFICFTAQLYLKLLSWNIFPPLVCGDCVCALKNQRQS